MGITKILLVKVLKHSQMWSVVKVKRKFTISLIASELCEGLGLKSAFYQAIGQSE